MQSTRNHFVTEFSAGGVRYVLPRRTLGTVRHAGWLVLGMGLLVTLFMVGWMSMPILEGVRLVNRQPVMGFGMIGFGLLGLFGLLPAMGMVLVGSAVIADRTRCEVVVRDGKIYSTERLFWFPWRRKCRTDQIRQLRVTAGSARDDDAEDVSPWFGDSSYAIVAERESARKFLIAPAYPRDLLLKLAGELAPRLEAELDSSSFYKRESVSRDEFDGPRSVAVVDDKSEPTSKPQALKKPVGSQVTIEQRDDGVTVRVPPAGVWCASKGLLCFALLWNAFVLVFLVMLVLTLFGVFEAEVDTNPWVVLVFLTPFVAVGVGVLLAAINTGKRYADIATAYDSLLVVHQSIFRKQVRQWTSDELERICVGPSGVEVNDQPVMELQFHPRSGGKYGLLGGRQEDELEWIAGQLRQSLGLLASLDASRQHLPSVERDKSGNVLLPEGSDIELRRSALEIQIVVPSVGLAGHLPMVLLGAVFLLVGCGVGIAVLWPTLKDGFQVGDLASLFFVSVWSLGFAGGGLGMLIGGLVAARRRFEIRVAGGQLQIDRFGPFGHRQFAWQASDVRTVKVADSGTKVNGRALRQVKVVPRQGITLGLLTDRSSSELSAVATAMRDALGLEEQGPDKQPQATS